MKNKQLIPVLILLCAAILWAGCCPNKKKSPADLKTLLASITIPVKFGNPNSKDTSIAARNVVPDVAAAKHVKAKHVRQISDSVEVASSVNDSILTPSCFGNGICQLGVAGGTAPAGFETVTIQVMKDGLGALFLQFTFGKNDINTNQMDHLITFMNTTYPFGSDFKLNIAALSGLSLPPNSVILTTSPTNVDLSDPTNVVLSIYFSHS
jgi:hypothetical protein